MTGRTTKKHGKGVLVFKSDYKTDNRNTVETARVTVESCDLSPHSATKVRIKALMKIALQHRARKRSVFVVQLILLIEASLGALFTDPADPKI